MITRIVKLPNHNNVLIGRDMAELFEYGHVYEVKKYLNEFIIVDIGETSLSESVYDSPNVNSSIEAIMCSCDVYKTKPVKKKLKANKC